MYFKNQEEVNPKRFKELEVSITDFCNKTGVHNPSLYHAFKTKKPRKYTNVYLNNLMKFYFSLTDTKEIRYFKDLQQKSIEYKKVKEESKRRSLKLIGFGITEVERIIK